jgi:hypothetical protein
MEIKSNACIWSLALHVYGKKSCGWCLLNPQ